MSVEQAGPLPKNLVLAALRTARPNPWRHRGWMRRRGLRLVEPMPAQPVTVPTSGQVHIDTQLDFVQCDHPGCCALVPVGEGCPVCGRQAC